LAVKAAVPMSAKWQVLTGLLALTAWFGPTCAAHADTTVRVVETWPPGDDVVLGRNQNFYLRLAYDADKPVGIWVTPYFHGQRVNVGSSPSQTYSGSGETFGWFFFMRLGDEVDEIRITAGDGSTNNTPVVTTWRGHVAGGSEAAGETAQPAWIAAMSARAKAAQDAAYRAQMNRPVSVGDAALFSGFMLVMLALGLLGFAAPAWGLWRWRGGWRLAAGRAGAGGDDGVRGIANRIRRRARPHVAQPVAVRDLAGRGAQCGGDGRADGGAKAIRRGTLNPAEPFITPKLRELPRRPANLNDRRISPFSLPSARTSCPCLVQPQCFCRSMSMLRPSRNTIAGTHTSIFRSACRSRAFIEARDG
jgi:hypothetical protein